MNFTTCTPIPLIFPSLHIFTLSLQYPPPPTPPNKNLNQPTNQLNKNLALEASVYRGVPPSLPFGTNSFTCKCPTSLCPTSLRLLASATLSVLGPQQDSSWISCCLCHGDPTALIVKAWPLQVLQQFMDGVELSW